MRPMNNILIKDMMIKEYPEYARFRDVYYDDNGNDVTPICIETGRFAAYIWECSIDWTAEDFHKMWELIYKLFTINDKHVQTCMELGFLEHIEIDLHNCTDNKIVHNWLTYIPEFIYKISPNLLRIRKNM